MRESFTTRGGVEIDTQGDAFNLSESSNSTSTVPPRLPAHHPC
jgi:hypothetical protein